MSKLGTRHTPPWVFGITNIPYGVSGTYSGVAMPFILRSYDVPLETIAGIGALCLLPSAYQLFWAPVIDLGIRRRSWLVLCSFLGAICLAGTLFIDVRQHLLEYQVVMVLGQALVGMVASCNGALVSTTVDPAVRGRAAGFVNAANLGSAALGGGVVLTLFNTAPPHVVALALALMIILPSFAAFLIDEPPPGKEPLFRHLGKMGKEVWSAVRSRRGWSGLLFCVSPVGTVALTNLFSGMGNEYHVSGQMIEWINGYGGGFVTAAGALASGYLLDKADNRKFYLAAGGLSFICCMVLAVAPHTPVTYVAGTLSYLLIAGLAYASFSSVVYDIVGTAGSTASTLYSVFPAAANQAIAYVLILDGMAHKQWGTRGLFVVDALLNIGGVIALLLLLRVVFPEGKLKPAVTPGHPEPASPLVAGGELSGALALQAGVEPEPQLTGAGASKS